MGEASKVSTVTQAVSPLPLEAGGNSEDEGKPCCENASSRDRSKERASVLACSDRFIDEQLQYGSFKDT